MAKLPYLKFFTDDYLSATSHLTTIEHGAYLLLLISAWRTPDCSLPNDDRTLAHMARMRLEHWRRVRNTVMSFWFLAEGRWRQKRLDQERKSLQLRLIATSNSAKAKWLKHKKSADANAYANDMRSGYDSRILEDSENPSLLSQTSKSRKPSKNGHLTVADDVFETFWTSYPKKVKKQDAKKAFARALAAAPVGSILAALEEHKAKWRGGERQFIPHPTTWLNGCRWEDQLETEGGLHDGRPRDVVEAADQILRRLEGGDGGEVREDDLLRLSQG